MHINEMFLLMQNIHQGCCTGNSCNMYVDKKEMHILKSFVQYIEKMRTNFEFEVIKQTKYSKVAM